LQQKSSRVFFTLTLVHIVRKKLKENNAYNITN